MVKFEYFLVHLSQEFISAKFMIAPLRGTIWCTRNFLLIRFFYQEFSGWMVFLSKVRFKNKNQSMIENFYARSG